MQVGYFEFGNTLVRMVVMLMVREDDKVDGSSDGEYHVDCNA